MTNHQLAPPILPKPNALFLGGEIPAAAMLLPVLHGVIEFSTQPEGSKRP